VNEETFDARMERLLRTLPPALRGMGFGDPDDVEYAHASDVVAWAIREIDRLREERRWVPVGERLPKPGETVLMLMDGRDPVSGWYENGHFHNAYDTPYVTHWMPLPPGPEGDG
jgi:hypothetical protein